MSCLTGHAVPIAHLFSDGERVIPIEEGGTIPLVRYQDGVIQPFRLPMVTHYPEGSWSGGWIEAPWDDQAIRYRQGFFSQAGAVAWLLAAARCSEARW